MFVSSPFAVAREELVQQGLEDLVEDHDVILAQVMAAGWAGVHLCTKRPLQASLVEGDREETSQDLGIDLINQYSPG